MSTTNLYGIQKNGDVTSYDIVKNSWLGGMHVWKTLAEKYNLESDFLSGFGDVWSRYNKSFYERYEDIVLGSTFDHVIVLKENFDELIESFKKYFDAYPTSNFDEQIEIINSMAADENIIGVAWCQTSVVDDLWNYDYDEEQDEIIPYNIFKGDGHFNLFDDIKPQK